MNYEIHLGDCIDGLRKIDDCSVNTCVTSPPYFGLRDYGVDGQIGLEDSPEEFISVLVEVFREVRRVLRGDGTLWLNLGDSYNGSGGQGTKPNIMSQSANDARGGKSINCDGLKPKDLIGIPWMAAFALRADGWYLRQDIIWHKPNPMPESVKDRCTNAHEYIFLLSKSKKYHYDSDAIAEPSTLRASGNKNHKYVDTRTKASGLIDFAKKFYKTRNKRSVWSVPPRPFPDAHFAVFPAELIHPCILAGCPEGGTVLDPFAGSGTTGVVAVENSRNFIGCELNPEYRDMALARLAKAQSMANLEWQTVTDTADSFNDMPLFREAEI